MKLFSRNSKLDQLKSVNLDLDRKIMRFKELYERLQALKDRWNALSTTGFVSGDPPMEKEILEKLKVKDLVGAEGMIAKMTKNIASHETGHRSHTELSSKLKGLLNRWEALVNVGYLSGDCPLNKPIAEGLKIKDFKYTTTKLNQLEKELADHETGYHEYKQLGKRYEGLKSRWGRLIERKYLSGRSDLEDGIKSSFGARNLPEATKMLDRMEVEVSNHEAGVKQHRQLLQRLEGSKKRWNALIESGYLKIPYSEERTILESLKKRDLDGAEGKIDLMEGVLKGHEKGQNEIKSSRKRTSELTVIKDRLISASILPDEEIPLESMIEKGLNERRWEEVQDLLKQYGDLLKRTEEEHGKAVSLREEIDDHINRLGEKMDIEIPEGLKIAEDATSEHDYREAMDQLLNVEKELKRQARDPSLSIETEMERERDVIKMGRWEKGTIIIRNKGKLHLKDISVSQTSENYVLDADERLPLLKGGEGGSIPVRIKIQEEGDVPLSYRIDYSILHNGEPGIEEKKIWIHVEQDIRDRPQKPEPQERMDAPDIEDVGIRRMVHKVFPGKAEKGAELSMGDYFSYKVERKIGSGGFSSVYMVSKDGTKFAMKVPKDRNMEGEDTIDLSRIERSKYRKEANIWANLTELLPSDVVKLYDIGVEPFPWFVMELSDRSLRKHMEDLSLEERMAIGSKLLGKIDRIHHQGIVHRDLKPENVLMIDGEPKFTDFGISKVITLSSHSTQGVTGTYHYMAPEQISRKRFGKVDYRTDIWQMGVLLYELMTDRFPFDVDDPYEISFRILQDEPILLSNVSRDLGPFDTILERAFEKKKEDRWQSAIEFKLTFDRVREDSGFMA